MSRDRALLQVVTAAEPAPIRQPDRQGRGYVAAWRDGHPNHCPGCDRQQWLVGRLLAECAFCGTAIPIVDERRVRP